MQLSVSHLCLVVDEAGAGEDDQGYPSLFFSHCYNRPVGGDGAIDYAFWE